jgi:hypothetical protein
MPADLFVTTYRNQFVATDADGLELYRGDFAALAILRVLRDSGYIGLLEGEGKADVYLCPKCATETPLVSGVWQCSGCKARLPVEFLPDLDRYIP